MTRAVQPVLCQICDTSPFKYTCSACLTKYCSVACYHSHKGQYINLLCALSYYVIATDSTCRAPVVQAHSNGAPFRSGSSPLAEHSDLRHTQQEKQESLPEPHPQRSLASLRWPYIQEQPSYPDPFSQDDVATLQLRQYEAIAKSTAVRDALKDNPAVRTLLERVDGLKDEQREREIERLLGVATGGQSDGSRENDRETIKQLAKAVEEAIALGSAERSTGLDWLED